MKKYCGCTQPTEEKFVVNVGVVCSRCQHPKNMRLLLGRLGFVDNRG